MERVSNISNKDFKKFSFVGLILALFIGVGVLLGEILGAGEEVIKLNAFLIGAAIGSIWFVAFSEVLFRKKMKISFLKFVLIVLTGILTSGIYFIFT